MRFQGRIARITIHCYDPELAYITFPVPVPHHPDHVTTQSVRLIDATQIRAFVASFRARDTFDVRRQISTLFTQ